MAYVRSWVRVIRKKTGKVYMEKDEARNVVLREGMDGEARVSISRKLGFSREVMNGYWVSADATASVSVNCKQDDEAIIMAMGVAEELAEKKAGALQAEAQGVVDDLIAEERANRRDW